MARILVGVTGGIAAYKAVELVRLLTKAGHSVRVVQTPATERVVGRANFEGITGGPVLVDEFEPDPARGAYPGETPPDHDPISHLELVRRADLFAVVPASANTIAKLAAGLADNLLTSAALASPAPLLLAPAMNDLMWRHPATAANVSTLESRGAVIVPPGTGQLASRGEYGEGRLAEPPEVAAAIEQVLRDRVAGGEAYAPRSLDGLRVLVTAGGTREPIDSVRYVGNRSSGRMGFALASEAASRGAEVTVVAANVALERDPAVDYIDVATAAELSDAVKAPFATTDVLLMAAAVADFRPAEPMDAKIKKAGRDELTVRLEATEDVLAAVSAQRRPGQLVVGFAAEHGEEALANARGKLEQKALDAVVVNDVSVPGIAFDAADNEVAIVTPAGTVEVPRASKQDVAARILDEVERLRASSRTAQQA